MTGVTCRPVVASLQFMPEMLQYWAVTQPGVTPRAACTPQRLAEVAHGGCFGTATKGPVEKLDLQPGEWVRVKSAEEIEKTLNSNYRNRPMGAFLMVTGLFSMV